MGHDSSNKQKLSIDSEMVYTVYCGLIQITDISFPRNHEGFIRNPFAFYFSIQRGFSGSIQTLPFAKAKII